ncbi:MAG: cytochrome c biogenesis protein CcdA [Methanosarcinales archaeon]|nr:cytochrome c biogenesis protein CcdA [ANME-2 cluster archaeon]MDW7775973.1 cytochrome c biogenesis protein CcdA [Methanosarcinales archaeon]
MTNKPVHPQYAISSLAIIIVVLFLVLFIVPSTGQPDRIEIEYFYEDGCSKCARTSPVLNVVSARYTNLTVYEYEILTEYDGVAGYDRMKVYGVYIVPAIVINRRTLITYSDYDGNTSLLEALLVDGIENAPPLIDNGSSQPGDGYGTLPELSLMVVLIAGLLAGFNPCLLAVMAFMASITLSSKGNRRDLVKIVVGFCAGIFAVYMVVGMGLLSLVKQHPEIQESITLVLLILIGLLGLWHFYDAYYMRVHNRSSLKTPRSFSKLARGVGGKNTLILSILAGGLFSMIKAPCVGAVYFAILDMLIGRGDVAGGAVYLAVYNLGVVLPVLALGILLAFGLSPERVDELRERRRIEIRLVTGAVLLLIVLLMYLNII